MKDDHHIGRRPDSGLPCAHVRELLGDGELSDAEREEVEGHIASCASCRKTRDEDQAVWTLLGQASLPPPLVGDAGFLAALRRRIRRHTAWRSAWYAAAAAVLVVGVSLFGLRVVTDEDEAIIANLPAIEALQLVEENAAVELADVGRAILDEIPPPDDEGDGGDVEDWIDLLDSILKESETKG